MNQDQFGSKIGVTKSTVSAYEHGDVFPPYEVMAKIVEVGKVSYDWLFTGLETIKEEKSSITYPLGEKEEKAVHAAEDLLEHYGLEKKYAIVEIHHPPPKEERLSEDEKQLLKNFRQLDQHKKSTVLEVAAMGALAVRELLEKETPENGSKEQKSA